MPVDIGARPPGMKNRNVGAVAWHLAEADHRIGTEAGKTLR
jgi:hypothetical protein